MKVRTTIIAKAPALRRLIRTRAPPKIMRLPIACTIYLFIYSHVMPSLILFFESGISILLQACMKGE